MVHYHLKSTFNDDRLTEIADSLLDKDSTWIQEAIEADDVE